MPPDFFTDINESITFPEGTWHPTVRIGDQPLPVQFCELTEEDLRRTSGWMDAYNALVQQGKADSGRWSHLLGNMLANPGGPEALTSNIQRHGGKGFAMWSIDRLLGFGIVYPEEQKVFLGGRKRWMPSTLLELIQASPESARNDEERIQDAGLALLMKALSTRGEVTNTGWVHGKIESGALGFYRKLATAHNGEPNRGLEILEKGADFEVRFSSDGATTFIGNVVKGQGDAR